MEQNNIPKYQSDAVESDWLDITYTQRKYLVEEAAAYEPAKPAQKPLFSKNVLRTAGIMLIIIGIVLGMVFINGSSDIFETARLAYTSSVLKSVAGFNEKVTVELPITASIKAVNSDGTVEITGGKLCMSLSSGKVKSITANTVTVEIEEDICYVYSALTSVLVKEGDEVTADTILGKYQDVVRVNVVVNNVVVTNIVGTERSFEWSN